jgi:transposase-like protein
MSEQANRSKYTKEFKEEALNLCKEPGYTFSLVAKRLGISVKQLYRWRKEYEASGPLAFPGNGREALSDKDRRIRELEKRLRDAELERDILKKAVGIFSKAPK